MGSSTFRMVQLTDLHLYASPQSVWKGFNTYASCSAVIEQVKALSPKPNVLVLTGDLSQDETPESYANLRDLIAPLGLPTYWIPGNHDQSNWANEILVQPPFSRDRSFEVEGWRFLLLSSVVTGQVHGKLASAELTWLAEQLASHPSQPTLIGLHHPPVPIHSAWMDQMSLQEPDAFLTIVDAHPQIRGVIFGHIHQAFEGVRKGVRYLGCPSTCMQFTPHQPEMAIDTQYPGFRQLTFYADSNWETQITRVPYPALI